MNRPILSKSNRAYAWPKISLLCKRIIFVIVNKWCKPLMEIYKKKISGGSLLPGHTVYSWVISLNVKKVTPVTVWVI